MKPETKDRIFKQGFTKGVGKGTGFGMAIASNVVTEKHDGTITCDSQIRVGTGASQRVNKAKKLSLLGNRQQALLLQEKRGFLLVVKKYFYKYGMLPLVRPSRSPYQLTIMGTFS